MTPADIEVVPEEREAGALAPEKQELAKLLLYCCGYVVLKRALPVTLVEHAREAHASLFEDCTKSAARAGVDLSGSCALSASEATQTSYFVRRGRWNVFPRLTAPFDGVQLIANPLVLSVVRPMLGRGLYCRFVTVVSPWSGSLLQSPHTEVEFHLARVPQGYVTHAPLVECDSENGPMEIYAGATHLWNLRLLRSHGLNLYVFDDRNPRLEELARYLPARKLELGPGDILIRDCATLHRGTPNRTEAPRPMFCVGYFRRGYHEPFGGPRLNLDRRIFASLPESIRVLFDHAFRPMSQAFLHDHAARLRWRIVQKLAAVAGMR